MVIGLHHVGRTVSDLRRTSHDLRAITGWPITTLAGPDDALVAGRRVLRTSRATGPNGFIELVHVDAAAGPRREVNEAGITHAAVQVGRIEEVVARLDEAGVDRHPGPVELGTGFRYLYVRDAEELVTEVEGAPHAPAELEPWLAHGAIATADANRLRIAYQALLGTDASTSANVRHHPEFDRGSALRDVDVSATWVRTANCSVEIWEYHHPATGPTPRIEYETPGAGHLAFETDDVDSDIQVAVDAGFEIEDPATTVDHVEIARLRDPDGNWVELLRFLDAGDARSLRQRPDLGRAWRMNALLNTGSR